LNDPDTKLVFDFLDALGNQRTKLILQLVRDFLSEQGITDIANMTVAELSVVKDMVRDKTSSTPTPRRRSTPRKKVEKPVVPVVVEEEPEEEPELEQSSSPIPAPTPIVEEIPEPTPAPVVEEVPAPVQEETPAPVAEEVSEPLAPEPEANEDGSADDYVNPDLLAGLAAFGF
jgi:outer membrane biosynthesis protein TonB